MPRMTATSKLMTADEAKAHILLRLRQGLSEQDAAAETGKVFRSYEYYLTSDDDFRNEVHKIRLMRQRAGRSASGKVVPGFPEFCRDYLGIELYRHQLQWVDLIEHREPRDLHPSQRYEKGFRDDFFVVNTPPDHAKTSTISVAYSVWRIVKDPNTRIIILSKTEEYARDIIGAIKERLSSKNLNFEKINIDFGPEGGFDGNSIGWRSDYIFVNSNLRTRAEKDPTCQAIGWKGQIYGKRADLIIADDLVDDTNVLEFEKQITRIQKQVQNRLVKGGSFLLIGTRFGAADLYSEIMKPERYPSGRCPYTYLSQPAVLEFTENVDDWVTLWPRSNVPPANSDFLERVPLAGPDGLYDRFTGREMAKLRDSVSADVWALVYMQAQVATTQIFSLEDILACTSNRRCGPLRSGPDEVRSHGMSGLTVIGGFDPAMVGQCGFVVLGVDRSTARRYLLDVWIQSHMQPMAQWAKLRELTERYGVSEWRIEGNAYQSYLLADDVNLQWFRSRGVVMSQHITGRNKHDPNFGVAAMAGLFKGHPDRHLMDFPKRRGHTGMQELVQELITWFPTLSATRAPIQDGVMALWFAELRCRELVATFDTDYWQQDNPYLSEAQESRRTIIDIDQWLGQRNTWSPAFGWGGDRAVGDH